MVQILLTLILALLAQASVTETVALMQAADGYSDLDFTVSEDPTTNDVILLTFDNPA